MNEKYIWPLVGVLLGWLLTTVTAGFRERNNRIQLIGNLLTKLIRVDQQLTIIIESAEKIKDISGGWENYEPRRKRTMDKHFMEPEVVINDLKSAIDEISPIYPLLAIEIEEIFHSLLQIKNITLCSVSETNEDAYIKMLSLHETLMAFTSTQLSNIVNKLALKHGISTFFKIKIKNFKRKKNLKNHVKPTMNKIIAGILEDYQKT